MGRSDEERRDIDITIESRPRTRWLHTGRLVPLGGKTYRQFILPPPAREMRQGRHGFSRAGARLGKSGSYAVVVFRSSVPLPASPNSAASLSANSEGICSITSSVSLLMI